MNRQNLINRLVARKLQPAAEKALCGPCRAANKVKALCAFCRAANNAKALGVTGTSK